VEFSYDGTTGPLFWHVLTNSSIICQKGFKQSPIDIKSTVALKKKIDPPCEVYVEDIHKVELFHNGNTIEVARSKEETGVEGEGNAFLPAQFNIGDETYKLLQFHFHTPSEHRIDKVHHDVEAHFVFESQNKNISVVAIFFNIGCGKDNAFLKPILNRKIPKPKERVKIYNIQLTKIFEAIEFIQNPFSYEGSLTTPPCTE
ncbi:181_t:CDS:2, partial [Scutellospora calospora]